MISVQYIPLSVRVRSWSKTLFTQKEIEEFLNVELSVIMNLVAQKEKIVTMDTSSYRSFALSMDDVLLGYIKVAMAISTGASKGFIKSLFHEFEIRNLKNVMRMILSGRFNNVLYPYVFTPSLTIRKLEDIRTFNDLSNALDGTPYRMFKTILEQVEQEKNALYWELALDNYYLNRLNHISRSIDGESIKAVKKLLLLPIYKDRIVFLYRYRFHYQVEPVEALRYIPNISGMGSYEEWQRLAFATSHTEFHQYLVEAGLITESTPNYAAAIKKTFDQQLKKDCTAFIHKDLTSIASFLAFMQLKKIQYQKITTVLESKTLQVSQADVLQLL